MARRPPSPATATTQAINNQRIHVQNDSIINNNKQSPPPPGQETSFLCDSNDPTAVREALRLRNQDRGGAEPHNITIIIINDNNYYCCC